MELDLVRGRVRHHRDARAAAAERVRPLRRLGLRARHPPEALRHLRRRRRGAPGAALDPRPARHRGARASRARGTGQRIPNPCTSCGGDGRVRATRHIEVEVPGRHRRRPAAPAHRPRPGRAARRCRRRPLRHRARAPAPDARAPRVRSRPPAPDRDDPGRARHRAQVETLDEPEAGHRPARHAAGSRLPVQGSAASRCCRAAAGATCWCRSTSTCPRSSPTRSRIC